MKTILIYDGSFDGFLTAVYQVFQEKLDNVQILKPKHYEPDMFSTCQEIITDIKKSKRVWKSLIVKASKTGANELHRTFLSEIKGVEALLLRYIIYVYSTETFSHNNYSNNDVLRVSQIARMVGREKHRMEAFVRFQLTKDGIYFSSVEPDFNVLPLIARHFKDRYADQLWIIYDFKRNYGLYYDLTSVERITFEHTLDAEAITNNTSLFDENEMAYKDLWLNYFESTNIKSRKNMKLHLRHIPRRYWKYLSEKRNQNMIPSKGFN
ncbi:TIGR03915 family putative DNA repair protein [Ascidiimonas sp. W6]|uniref:TIGR03915 family putative DNA repair protein n=1 Tax=Ascidiimonas meishanensis TaxID=3128903 RepID=UPI0030EBB726